MKAISKILKPLSKIKNRYFQPMILFNKYKIKFVKMGCVNSTQATSERVHPCTPLYSTKFKKIKSTPGDVAFQAVKQSGHQLKDCQQRNLFQMANNSGFSTCYSETSASNSDFNQASHIYRLPKQINQQSQNQRAKSHIIIRSKQNNPNRQATKASFLNRQLSTIMETSLQNADNNITKLSLLSDEDIVINPQAGYVSAKTLMSSQYNCQSLRKMQFGLR